jgi:glycosyltransferase involved in cell wall biosynthesis
LLPLGVDISVFTPGAGTGAARRRLGLPEDRFTVFTVRNLEPRMGLENLVDAAAAVAAERPDVLFIIGGRGSLSGALAARIKERGLSGSVRLAGYIPEADLADHYRSADLFVLPTKELEGFGLVTLEALACGAPVLATPVGANAEVLGAFGPEFLLKDCSAESIAAGIAGFMRGPGADPGLRARCRRFVEENYSWEKYAAGVEKELYRAAGGGANGR